MAAFGMVKYIERSNLPAKAKASIAETYEAMRTPHGQLAIERTSGHKGAALRMARDTIEVGITSSILAVLHSEFPNGLDDMPVDAIGWLAGSLVALAVPGTEISETAKNVYKTSEAVFLFRHVEALYSKNKGKPSKTKGSKVSGEGECCVAGEDVGDPVLAFGRKMKTR